MKNNIKLIKNKIHLFLQLLLDGKNFHADFMYATLHSVLRILVLLRQQKLLKKIKKIKIEHHND